MNSKSFVHSGELGDIIYSLTVIKKLGGGKLYLDLSGGEKDPYCKNTLAYQNYKTRFSKKGFDFLKPLLDFQDYIDSVEIYDGQNIDINLNKFRETLSLGQLRTPHGCIIDAYQQSHDLPPYDVNESWLTVGEVLELDKGIVITRSPRYQGAHIFFKSNVNVFNQNAIFVGTKKEHDLFNWALDADIEYYETNNALEVARVIAGSKQFVSNSTFGLALGVGVSHDNIIQELDSYSRITLFPQKKGMKTV